MQPDPSEIEEEPEDPMPQDIHEPFDPNKIRVNLWTPTLDLLLKRMREGEIDLAPDFQREAGLWKPKNRSRLIESLLVRIPLPAFYLDAVSEDRMAVIDGIQRLTALREFVDGEATLVGLEFLKDLEGCSFKGLKPLPRPLQRRIEETMVTVYVVEKGTPDAAKLNIFKRINTGGLALSAQEIRHAMNPGPVRDWLKKLAGSEAFKEATDRAVKPHRMDDRECVTRFVAFSLTPYASYTAVDFDGFLNEAMRRVNQMTGGERDSLEGRFEAAMRRATALFGNDAFRKRTREDDSRNPVNRAMFESWSVALAALSAAEFERVAGRRPEVRALLIEAFNKPGGPGDPSLLDSVSFGTGDSNKVTKRFSEAARILSAVCG